MSPVATSAMTTPQASEEALALLKALYTAPDALACRHAARQLASHVLASPIGLECLAAENILADLTRAASSISGYERESAMVGMEELFRELGEKGGAEPYLLPLLPVVLERYRESGKGDVVKEAAEKAAKVLVSLPPPEAVPRFFLALFVVISSPAGSKWKVKAGALSLLAALPALAPSQTANRIGIYIPLLEPAMRDTKLEVSAAAQKAAKAICGVLENVDVLPFVDTLVNCMARPDTVPEAIKALSSNVWVREVDSPTLAVLVPLLVRALSQRSTVVQRQTAVLIGNLFKLVRQPELAAKYLADLLPGVVRMAESAAFPEIRAFAKEAEKVLVTSSGADEATVERLKVVSPAPSGAATPIPPQAVEEAMLADEGLAKKILTELFTKANGGTVPSAFAEQSLVYQAASIAALVRERDFNPQAWDRHTVSYLTWFFLSPTVAASIASENLKRWLNIDSERQAALADDRGHGDDGEEKIVDLSFSLAYGGLLLLNHTSLKLVRGRRYAVLGANGCGKSTLLKAIDRKQIEGFPEGVSTFYVEHDIDGDDSDIGCLEFLTRDRFVKAKSLDRSTISSRMIKIGFDEARQSTPVSALSGGWKMRLALARAMLCEADLLLLDEPTNHLDRASVDWLQEYLTSPEHKVTIITISHDSGFLDSVATDCIHYQSKQLVYYRGNLSKFVEKYPAAKSYYTLSASLIKFVFPPPGALMGVRSQTRAILKATDVTYTYPGAAKPSLTNASCAVTLSSRVGVVGPNGAGKSTLIKLLTGETVPDFGKIEKHPNLRVAYVAQHAFHNIGAHLEKSAVQYIAWRYQDGHDREQAMKQSRKLTPEEKAQMEVPIEGRNGEQRKLEMIIGRQKLKKSFQYECKWRGLDHRFNAWIPRERLIELGFSKLVQEHDDLEASREGSGSRELSFKAIRQHLVDVGLDGDIAEYNEMKGLSGGQKVKVVIAAALWSKPQVMIFDEPTNFLDRDALGGLAVAIRDWAGAFVCISHNEEFVGALCPEIWNVDAGCLIHKGKATLVEGDVFEDGKRSKGGSKGTPSGSKAGSKVGTPVPSAPGSAVNSGTEGAADAAADDLTMPVVKKKKLTRKQLKEREERRRLRKLRWLSDSTGAPREPDTDSEDER